MTGYERYDEDVAAFWDRVGDSGSGRVGFAVRHPAVTWKGLRQVRRLPRLHYEPGTGVGARALLATLRRRQLTRHDFALFGAAVLTIPDDPATLLQGRRQQTMRRMLRKAEKAGLTCRAVQPHERVALLKRANAMEQQHRLDTYRVEQPDNDDLLDHPLWRVCELHGRPVLLSVTPVDGAWACLRYFRTLGASEHHTLARWLSTYDLASELSARGVRHLLDTEPPAVQTNGVRHFQRMLGFRYVVVTRPMARGWRLGAAGAVVAVAGTATVGTAAATGILPERVTEVLPLPDQQASRPQPTPEPARPSAPTHSHSAVPPAPAPTPAPSPAPHRPAATTRTTTPEPTPVAVPVPVAPATGPTAPAAPTEAPAPVTKQKPPRPTKGTPAPQSRATRSPHQPSAVPEPE